MTEPETKIVLPKGFLIGAATSAHQVEGNNTNNDWWHAEQAGKVPKSGQATDHYHKYEEDFTIAQDIGLNAFRISIAWSRIEPQEGQWDNQEVEHYRKVLQSMKAHGLTRMVTLWHFAMPQWLADKGGFESSHAIEAFARYAAFVAQNLGDEIDLWCTVNEPELYAGMGYNKGKWPPFKHSVFGTLVVIKNIIQAHKKAYKAIKQVRPEAKIGVAKNSVYYEPYRRNNILDQIIVWVSNTFGNHYFLERIVHELDFIGINYYFYNLMSFSLPDGVREMNFNFLKNRPEDKPEVMRSDMGWRTYPKGLYHVLLDLKKFNKPIYITENGIANARDDMRKDFIREHLRWVARAIRGGADVRGYFYWSLIDNYEWADGYGPLFGLVEINRETLERKVRPSAEVIKEIEIQK
ncbi:MAG: glycoside hydrolase family 1 protein [Candidatus Doudnabacteria bacterium]|nr:glycoside hydrolase family 1 protein [Candidatus Doudnabacteria bacterium]